MGRRSRQIYLPLDIDFFDNDKILRVGEKPAWLYLAMCCRAKRLLSDGILSEHQIDRLHITGWRKRLQALAAEELVMPTDDGRWLIVGWLERNMSAEQVEKARERDRVRKDSGRNPAGIRPDPREGKGREEEEKSKSSYPQTGDPRLDFGTSPVRAVS